MYICVYIYIYINVYIYICIYIYYNRYPTNIHLKQASFYWNMVDFYRYFTSIDGFTRL